MTEWIKCSERLPANGAEILFIIDGCTYVGERVDDYFQESIECRSFDNEHVSHWMLIPKLPEDLK